MEITSRGRVNELCDIFQYLPPQYYLKSLSNLAIMLLLEVASAQTCDPPGIGFANAIFAPEKEVQPQKHKRLQFNNSVKGNS